MQAPKSSSEFSRVLHAECSSRDLVLKVFAELQDNFVIQNYRKKIDITQLGVSPVGIYSIMRWEKKAQEFENFGSRILLYPDGSFWAYNAGAYEIEIGWSRNCGSLTVSDVVADWDCGEFANSFASLVASFGVEPELITALSGADYLWIWEKVPGSVGQWVWSLEDDCPLVFSTYAEAEEFIGDAAEFTICHPC